MVDSSSSSKGIARSVDDLLTTRQLQELLQVDRITIYRMLNDGRLHGFKVGGQWRFSRQEIETWLREQRIHLGVAEELSPTGEIATPSSKVLSISCVQAIQDICAEALNVAAVTIDPDGTLLTGISNSCDFCDLILSSDEGQRHCAAAWRALGNGRAHRCHAGLLCVCAPIEVGGKLVAITSGCQFAVRTVGDGDQMWAANLSALAADLGLSEDDLQAAAGTVRLVPEGYVLRVTRLFQRIADTLSELGEERLGFLGRLQYIAEMSKVD